jgi:chorismate mutase
MGSGIYPEYPGEAVDEPELSQRAVDLLQRLDALFESGQFDPTKITRIWNPLTGEVVDTKT